MNKTFRRNILAFAVLMAVGLTLGHVLRPSLRSGVNWSRGYYDFRGTLLRVTLTTDDKFRVWTNLKEFDPKLIEAVLLKEDRFFRYHWGVNPYSIARAIWQTYGLKGRRLGGSTLTMQLARLRYGIYSKSISGKMRQMVTALWLETFYSKDEILETYLNLLPYGSNIEGAGTASLVFFHRSPRRLTLSEIFTLAVIPQSPTLRALNRGRESQRLVDERKSFFQNIWAKAHPKDKIDAFELNSPVSASTPEELPFIAPHFINSLTQSSEEVGQVTTTLDLKLQRLLEMKIKSYVENHRASGITNAAALLIDWHTMEVKASVGSADFFNGKIQGQVNGVTSKRSPGSTLKPFVYALAFDEGLAQPQTLLKDAPIFFGAFDPENFDKDFIGPVTASDALIKSRNVPAVSLASKLQHPTFYEFLTRSGITNLQDEKFYGLASVLGGVEVTMEELVTLYASLANGGHLKPLRKLRGDVSSDGKVLFSPEAAFLTLDILRQNPRNGQSLGEDISSSGIPVFWKTGTSQGFRDAWSVGITGPFVYAVWLGNFDGSSNPAFVGRDLAGPLFFDIADGLREYIGRLPPFVPKASMNLTKVDVCAVSGALPGPHCHHLRKTWYIPGRSPIQTCQIHREIQVSKLSGLRTCPSLGENSLEEVFEFWPSDLIKIFSQAGMPRKTPPEWDKRCSQDDLASGGLPPQITSPRQDITYYLRASAEALVKDGRIALTAVTDSDVREMFWFVNDAFVGKTSGMKPFLWSAKLGKFTVRVVDDHGRSDRRFLNVKLTD